MVSSDERLKRIRNTYEAGLEEILTIRPVQYNWREETGFDSEGVYTGFSAQNIELALPAAVSYDKNGFRTVSDRTILAAVVNAVRELWEKVTGLEEKVEEIDDLRLRIETLEAALDTVSPVPNVGLNEEDESTSNLSDESRVVPDEPVAPNIEELDQAPSMVATSTESEVGATTNPAVNATSTDSSVMPEVDPPTTATDTTPTLEPTAEPELISGSNSDPNPDIEPESDEVIAAADVPVDATVAPEPDPD